LVEFVEIIEVVKFDADKKTLSTNSTALTNSTLFYFSGEKEKIFRGKDFFFTPPTFFSHL
jgi:hypothetical protein